MFKSSRKRDNRLNFQEELNQRLNLIKDETPVKEANVKRNREMAIILDEAVEELVTPKEKPPKQSFHDTHNQRTEQIQELLSLQLDENSSNSLNSRQDHFEHQPKKIQTKDHISYLFSHPEVIKLLIDIYPYCSEKERISFSDFIRKIYIYYYGITVKEEELAMLEEKLKIELTTTDPQYLSLNALEIIAKRHKLIVYFMSFYIATKIQLKIAEYQKNKKRMLYDLKERQERLKECEERLNADEEEYARKYTTLVIKEKAFNAKVKEFNQRQKQLRKSIQDKTAKLYEGYLAQFNEKIKQAEKRLNNSEKNLKYKIDILERRSQTLKQLINEKNDIKSKKVIGENEAKIRLRKVEKEMEQVEKKYQNQIQVLQKEEKEMLKSYSLLQEKLAKVEKKSSKYRERVGQLQEELALVNEEHQKIVSQRNELEQKLHSLEHQPLRTSNNQECAIKIMKQKTSRSSKNKKKAKSLDHSQIINLYQCLLQCQSRQAATSHSKHQQLIQKMMKTTIKELPTLINLLSSNQEEEDLPKEPHYLVLNITKLILKEFYLLNPAQEASKHNESKLRSSDIQQLLKYPYRRQTRFSIFLLFLQIYDWTETSSACFFSKTIQVLIQEADSQGFLTEKGLIANQMQLMTSAECVYFLANNFYGIDAEMDKDSRSYENRLVISIAVTDLLIHLVKVEEECIFDQLIEREIQKLVSRVLVLALSTIMQVYSSQKIKGKNIVLFACIEFLQELAEKLSILLQRIHYKYSKQIPQNSQTKKIRMTCLNFLQLNRSTGNRHSLITANLNSILNFTHP